MKTTLETKSTRNAVKFVAALIPRRTQLPILSNVHCYSNGHFEVTATDLDTTLIARCPSQTTIEGRATIPSRTLLDAVAGNGSFDLSFDDKSIATFTAGAIARTVHGLSADEFPPTCNMPETARRLVLPADKLIAAIKAVYLAQSTDESRYVINGICFEIAPDCVRLIATDGRRLHVAEIPGVNLIEENANAQNQIDLAQIAVECAQIDYDASKEKFPRVLVPIEGKDNLFKYIDAPEISACKEVLDNAKGVLSALTATNQFIIPSSAIKHILRLPIDKKIPGVIRFATWSHRHATGGDMPLAQFDIMHDSHVFTVQTKLVEGNYPNYRQVIPAEFKERIILQVAEFKTALVAAEKVTTDKSNSVKLEFTKHLLTIKASSPEVGAIAVPVPINYAGKDFAIAFNPAYLIELCTSFAACEEMEAHFIDDLSPGAFKNAAGAHVVIMPMRLS